jgi:hypothetical protein
VVSFIKGAALRERIFGYLAICETTQDETIELLRLDLLSVIDESYARPNSKANKKISLLWKEFQAAYSEHFAVKHDAIMRSHQLQEKFDEISKSDEWWEFESLSSLPVFQDNHWKQAQRILRQLRELDCSFDVRENLQSHPFCGCSFNLAKMDEWENLPDKLMMVVEDGRASFRRTLVMLKANVIRWLEQFLKDETDRSLIESGAALLEKFETNSEIKSFTANQLIILHKLLNTLSPSKLVKTEVPAHLGVTGAEQLRVDLNEWINDLPAEPILLKVE